MLDAEDRLVGIVTYDDVIDVVVSEATEDVHRMGGVAPLAENYLEASFVKIWWKRAFWLSCLFGAELLTFTALSTFEDAIAAVVVLSLFVPLCISTGGNSGSQAATLITRAMALGQVRAQRLAARAAARNRYGIGAGRDAGRHRFRPRRPDAQERAQQFAAAARSNSRLRCSKESALVQTNRNRRDRCGGRSPSQVVAYPQGVGTEHDR